ncbi:uncharacterized protein V6R79_004723 [Siganus canaliculatus]
MAYLKKYFTEGLIQMAILLSLCGVRVDVGLEPYLPPSWHEMILGPTSALTQTQFHNLRNRLEDGHGLHPKSVDLDGFFTARRLLGWVHSLDRLQVPHPQLETWLVQREPDPLPMEFPDQNTPMARAAAGTEMDRLVPSVESIAALGSPQEQEEEEDTEEETPHVLRHSGGLDESGEEEEEDLTRLQQFCRRAERGGRAGASYNRELSQNDVDQTSFSLQECLRLLDETFPFTEEQQLHDSARRRHQDSHPPDRDPMQSPIIATGNPSLDLELDWQDLLAIMEPEDANTECLQQNRDDRDDEAETESNQDVPMETDLQDGFLGSQPGLEPTTLYQLTPSEELDEPSLASNTRQTLEDSSGSPLQSPPDHTDLLAEDASEDLHLGQNADDNLSGFNMNLLAQDFAETDEGGLYSEYGLYPENIPSSGVNSDSQERSSPSLSPPPKEIDRTQDFLISPSSIFLVDDEDVEDEEGLPSPLRDLLEEDAAILDEISLLDLALEEGFSPEMAARLDEEGYLSRDEAQQRIYDSSTAVTESQDHTGRHQQDCENEADSDSGLSLDFSHSLTSPCASEASSYSSSTSSSSSSSSSSCMSAERSPFSEDEDAEDDVSDLEVQVTIKQEELEEEEEMGAVGGEYLSDLKPFAPSHDSKLFNGFPWLEHVGHDHTYNQPWSPESSPSVTKMSTKPIKSSLRHESAKPYYRSSSSDISASKMWSRDEKRARVLKIPFSNELIVNLPVEDFNDLLASFQLSEEQLALIRDIRRRGKNKIAAQNCRKRKMDVLLGLRNDVSGLKRYRSRLLREKQEALRNLQEMKRQLSTMYQEVFSRLRDEEGRPLDAMEYLLRFEPNGSVMVTSRQQQAAMPSTKANKKQRDKKK